jgi:hypothetical protein
MAGADSVMPKGPHVTARRRISPTRLAPTFATRFHTAARLDPPDLECELPRKRFQCAVSLASSLRARLDAARAYACLQAVGRRQRTPDALYAPYALVHTTPPLRYLVAISPVRTHGGRPSHIHLIASRNALFCTLVRRFAFDTCAIVAVLHSAMYCACISNEQLNETSSFLCIYSTFRLSDIKI